MLPARARMRASEDFRSTVTRGRRSGCPRLIVHLLVPPPPSGPDADATGLQKARSKTYEDDVKIGFVVSRKVGGAVTRNAVQRRLRHCARAFVDELPAGSRVVVRALPAAAEASYPDLSNDLQAALQRCLQGGGRRNDVSDPGAVR